MATFYDTKVDSRNPDWQERQSKNNELARRLGSFYANPSKRDVPAGLDSAFYRGEISLEDVQSKIAGSPDFNPNIGPQIDYGQGKQALTGAQAGALAQGKNITDVANMSPQSLGTPNTQAQNANIQAQNQDIQTRARQAFEQVKNQPITQDASGQQVARTALGQPPKPSVADNLVQTDPYFADIQKMAQDYFSPTQQRQSLTQEYQNLLATSGIQGLDTELLNMKTVLEGTEDDIRNEVVKAGGFATESQVMALTNARNKQLIKNYNNLLETRNAKEQYLDKMMSLSSQDRQEANQRFDSMMNIGFKMADYQQKMQQNAQEAMQRVATNVGYSGLYDSALASGDPKAISRAESLLGVDPGQLAPLAELDRQARAQVQQMQALDVQAKKAQIANTYSQIAERQAATAPVNGVPQAVMSKLQAAPEYKTINAVLPAINAIKAYKSAIDTYGTGEAWSGEGEGQLDGTYSNALVAWKSLAALGALSGADFSLAESAIPKPTLYTRTSKQQAKLEASLQNAVTQTDALTKRLIQNYPQAADLLNQQLSDIKVTKPAEATLSTQGSQPQTMIGADGKLYTKAADGKYY